MADPTEAIIRPDGTLTFAGRICRAALGRAGLTAHKEEGDGATPIGALPLRRLLYRADRLPIPRTTLPREPIGPDDGWCDDPTHPDYNTQIRLPHPARHERLWRDDTLYDLIVVLGWNDSPIQRRRGSAIFLHLARPDLPPTDGCIALVLPDIQHLLAAGVTTLQVG